MPRKRPNVYSFQELIDSLEHIELDQLHSDIPANVRAELTHMKSNLSAILSFLGNCVNPDPATEPNLCATISTVRRECMSLHLTISKLLLIQFLRLNTITDSQYPALASAQYERIAQAVCEICQIFAPQFTQQLGNAL
jgi:hypothetical protein